MNYKKKNFYKLILDVRFVKMSQIKIKNEIKCEQKVFLDESVLLNTELAAVDNHRGILFILLLFVSCDP